MFVPTEQPITDFRDSFDPPTAYTLRDVRLEIPDESMAIFHAITTGPEGKAVWVRAWVSNEADGTLAEAEIGDVPAGQEVQLQVKLLRGAVPELACMRIESEPLATKHTVHVNLMSASS